MSIASDLERYMLGLINAERAAEGLSSLVLEQTLNASAEIHSEWALETDTFSHTGDGGSTPTDRIREAGFDLSGSWRTGENLAIQSLRGPEGLFDDVADLHESLMNSPGHRANILNPGFEAVGIGIETGSFAFSSGTYLSIIATQNFGATMGELVLDPASAPETAPEPDPEPTPEPEPEPTPPSGGTPVPPPADDAMDLPTHRALGTRGADRLEGHPDGSLLIGLGDADRLEGGAGADVFVFLRTQDGPAATVAQFGPDDRLALDDRLLGLGDADIDPRPVTARMVETALGSGKARYDRDRGELWLDPDGDTGDAPARLVALIEDGIALRADDLILF